MKLKPVQRPHPPIWFGGDHADAIRRAATFGDGWMGSGGSSIAYWEEILRKMVKTPEWKQDLEDNFWVNAYTSAAETRRRLEREYAEIKQVMSELGMAKVK